VPISAGALCQGRFNRLARRPDQRQNESLFASFSSEKEEFFLF
jgi:hypothetical protein